MKPTKRQSKTKRTPRDVKQAAAKRVALMQRHQAAFTGALTKRVLLGTSAPIECAKRENELRLALATLRDGTTTPTIQGDLIDAANIAGFRLDDGDFQEAALLIKGAKAATESLYDTYEEHGRYIPRAHELNLLEEFIDVYMTMMRNSTLKEWNTAQQKLIDVYNAIQKEKAAA